MEPPVEIGQPGVPSERPPEGQLGLPCHEGKEEDVDGDRGPENPGGTRWSDHRQALAPRAPPESLEQHRSDEPSKAQRHGAGQGTAGRAGREHDEAESDVHQDQRNTERQASLP